MHKDKRKFNCYRRITAVVILASFLTIPASAEPPITPPPNSSGNETKLYSDSEVALLIEDLTEAAKEAIEQAAAEAAKAAALASLEREAGALQEARKWRFEADTARRNGTKSAVIAGFVCFFGGFAVGVSGTLLIQGGR